MGLQKALQVHQRLIQLYGERPKKRHLDPIAQLVSTILSQNTNDVLRDKAFHALQQRFPTWEQVRDAPVEEVIKAVQIAGLSQKKAPRIQQALRYISAKCGKLSLDFLRQMGVEEAKQWLTAMNGIGPKTAAIILLFSLDMPAFPVDTHIHRVTRRLGLIPERTSREKAHELLEALLPQETYYTFHLNVIRHGREVCQARRPHCEQCALRDLCDDYQNTTHPQAPEPSQA
ncbi:MAG: endonuclease III domain-containing protein [Anaerolineae bacterium]